MIDFMIIGLPRSGTTWAANFFTTDHVMCFHDPLYTTHYTDWDKVLPTRAAEGSEVGVSCTGIWRWSDWVNEHPAKKLILHRDLDQINESMRAIGMDTPVGPEDEQKLNSIIGLHVPFSDLFDPKFAQRLWQYLTRNAGSFPAWRHQELVHIEMQPKFSGLSVGPQVTRRLMNELQNIAIGL